VIHSEAFPLAGHDFHAEGFYNEDEGGRKMCVGYLGEEALLPA